MLYLLAILLVGFILRFYGLNWDQGFHLHPDERALIMVTERIHFFNQLNPDFFNYGSLPIYLLKGVSQLLDFLFSTQFNSYQGMLYVGRYLSIFFDLGTILLIYKIANILFSTDSTSSLQASSNNNEGKLRAKSRSLNHGIALFSSFFYAIAFFPIQNSHFFVVDVFLTTFTTLLTYLLLKYLSLPIPRDRTKLVIFIGTIFAAMLATKFTAIIFYPIVILIFIISAMKQWNNRTIILSLFLFHVSCFMFYFFFMPYAFLEYQRFFSDITAQMRMNSDPYIFPYTLQYIGTLPYLYYLKNIFLWGLGPILSVLSLIGLLNLIFTSRLTSIARRIIKLLFERSREQYDKLTINNHQLTIFFLFYFFYFLIIGRSAVKFMRYMLPVYPFFSIMAGYGLYSLLSFRGTTVTRNLAKRNFTLPSVARFLAALGMTVAVIWTLMFVNIYSQKHTRVAATEWILQNIPKGSTLALEHWDDGLPLRGGENYNFVELTLYDQPDDELKWLKLNERLFEADYLIIASNRLYVPLQKLSDCKKYKACYPKTAEYYSKLFNNSLVIPSDPPAGGESRNLFKKVAEFVVKPQLEVGSWKLEVDDQSADESFTVYDHPKIFIFKKT